MNLRTEILQALLRSPGSPGARLPSVRTLAKSFGAAPGTARSALAELCDGTRAYAVPGKGCFWGKRPERELPELPETQSESLARKFREDWTSGYLKPDLKFPMMKELCARYGVSLPLLRHFLTQKAESGAIVRLGHGRYRFAYPKTPGNEGEVLLVTRCDRSGYFPSASERETEFLRSMYRRAAENNLKLRLIGFHEASGMFLSRSGEPCTLSDFPRALGAVVSTLLVWNPENMLAPFHSVTYPVSVWWEQPPEKFPRFLKGHRWAFFNATFGTFPGMIVGEFLKKRGCSSVAYISPYHASSWSADRFSGLEKSGLGVTAFTDAEFASPWDFRELARKNGGMDSVEMRARALCEHKLKEIAKDIPPFDAWVCVNDEVASILQDLSERGEIPRPPYMVGFDNSEESYLMRLDSFEFNIDTMVSQALFHLLFRNADSEFSGELREVHGSVIVK